MIKIPTIGVEMPEELAQKVKQKAEKEYCSKSAIIRKLVAEGLKQEDIDYERTRSSRA